MSVLYYYQIKDLNYKRTDYLQIYCGYVHLFFNKSSNEYFHSKGNRHNIENIKMEVLSIIVLREVLSTNEVGKLI